VPMPPPPPPTTNATRSSKSNVVTIERILHRRE
jgi:hypothetical protein